MSLIVARRFENQLCITSDTKLYHPFHETKGLKANPKEGTIKTVILTDDICISFAGEIDFADMALKELGNETLVSRVIDCLKKYHQQSKYKTEFLLYHQGTPPVIYKFKKDEYGPVQTAWIGDNRAFNLFQESILGTRKKKNINKKNKKSKNNLPAGIQPSIIIEQMNLSVEQSSPDIFSKMSKSMDEVIENGIIESVGGFKVNVAYDNRFRYNYYTKLYRGSFAIVGTGGHTIGHGDAQEGAYSINFFGGSKDHKTVALHIKQSNLGILYHRKDFGLFIPEVYSLDEVDFSDMLIDKYNLFPPFATQSKADKLAKLARKLFEQQDFENALLNFEKAADLEKGVFKADMLFYKGVTLLNLGRNSDAMQTFKEAEIIKPQIRERVNELFKRGPVRK
jgi:hypothetical protein